MIKSPTANVEANREFLRFLTAGAELETSRRGFEYQVYDPAKTPDGADLVFGSVVSMPDQVEVDLYLSGTIPREVRGAMADICVASAPDDDRYTVARAADTILGLRDGFQLDRSTIAFNALVMKHMQGNMHLTQLGFDSQRKSGDKVQPRVMDTYRSTIGWLAFRRQLSDEGSSLYGQFSEGGLWIPHFESEERVTGLLQRKNGEYVKAGFVYMPENSERHHCAQCSGQLLKGTTRVTLQLDNADERLDHHHYHTTCFLDKVLPKFKFESLAIDTNHHAREINAPK